MSNRRPRFGRWYPLDEDTINKKVDPNWDGVYKIRVRRKKGGSKPIQDIKGPGQIIYIGSSRGETYGSGPNFRLKRHLKSTDHTNPCMIKVRKSYDLEFGIKVTESKKARNYESLAINEYYKTFGKLPLCNSVGIKNKEN